MIKTDIYAIHINILYNLSTYRLCLKKSFICNAGHVCLEKTKSDEKQNHLCIILFQSRRCQEQIERCCTCHPLHFMSSQSGSTIPHCP